MSGIKVTVHQLNALMEIVPYETMASPAADAAIKQAWPEDDGELPDEQSDAADVDGDLAVDEEDDVEDAVEREIQEELLREQPSDRKPLRSAMRRRTDDDVDTIVKPTRNDDSDSQAGDEEVGSDEDPEEDDDDDDDDDLTLPSDDEVDVPVLVVRKPLLPEFRPDFSSSDDSQLSADAGFEYEDDEEDDWLSTRDYEPEDGDDAAAAAVKKKTKKSKKPSTAAASGSGGKRKRAVSTDDAGTEQKVARKALVEHKSRQSKMSAEEQQAVVRLYIKVATVDCVMQAEHIQNGGTPESYKSFRALVLEEATLDGAEDEIKALAHAVLDIEADITDTVATTKRAEPDAMQLLSDFVFGGVALTFDKDAVPATASRCDVTLQPCQPADLVLGTATATDGKVRCLVMRAAIQHVAQNLWTLVNFYAITISKVVKALAAHKRLSTADAITAIEADDEFTKRIAKLLGEAHSKTCWHVRIKLGSK